MGKISNLLSRLNLHFFYPSGKQECKASLHDTGIIPFLNRLVKLKCMQEFMVPACDVLMLAIWG